MFLLRDKMIKHYIHERYEPLTILAAALLVISSLALTSGVSNRQGSRQRFAAVANRLLRQTGAVILLVVPLVIGFMYPPQVLGVSKSLMGNRFTFSNNEALVDEKTLSAPGPSDRTIEVKDAAGGKSAHTYTPLNMMEINYLLSAGGDVFAGDRVAIRGFVYHQENHPGGFTLVRYNIPCCVVHAYPVMIDVVSPEASSLKDSQWVTVYGQIEKNENVSAGNNGGEALPYQIKSEKITRDDEPQDPYISKWFMHKPFSF